MFQHPLSDNPFPIHDLSLTIICHDSIERLLNALVIFRSFILSSSLPESADFEAFRGWSKG